MRFKVTKQTHLIALKGLIKFGLIAILTSLFMIYFIGLNLYISLFIPFSVYFSFHLIPTIILYLNHYKYAKNKVIDFFDKKIKINNEIYYESQINSIHLYATMHFFGRAAGVYSSSYSKHYYLIRIKLKDGKKIVINELFGGREIINAIKVTFPNSEINEVPTFFFGLIISTKEKYRS